MTAHGLLVEEPAFRFAFWSRWQSLNLPRPLLCLQPLAPSPGQTMGTSQASWAFQPIQRPLRAPTPCGLSSFILFRNVPFSVVRGQQVPGQLTKQVTLVGPEGRSRRGIGGQKSS